MIFPPGTYYLGDPGYVLPGDDLRNLFCDIMRNNIPTGPRSFLEAMHLPEESVASSFYWVTATPHKTGTLYDQQGKGWGFDWGCFGVVPWLQVTCAGAYEDNKIEFSEPFECLAADDSITIGHFQFTLNPK